MTMKDYLEHLLVEKSAEHEFDEKAVYEAASLITGSFVYNLYQLLWLNDLNNAAIVKSICRSYGIKEYFSDKLPVVDFLKYLQAMVKRTQQK